MVKAELIENPQNIEENPQETGLTNINSATDVDTAIADWKNYQRICKEILDDDDHQAFMVTEKDENGNKIKIKKKI